MEHVIKERARQRKGGIKMDKVDEEQLKVLVYELEKFCKTNQKMPGV